MQVVVFPTIHALADIRSCIQVCAVFYGEFKRIVIERMDIHNLEYKALPPFFVKFVLNLPEETPVGHKKTEDSTIKNIDNQKIIFRDKYDRTFEIKCGKVLNGPLKRFKYPKLGDLNSALTDLKDADLYSLQSSNQIDGGGCGLRILNTKTTDTHTHTQYGLVRSESSLVSQGYVLKFNDNEYMMNFSELTSG